MDPMQAIAVLQAQVAQLQSEIQSLRSSQQRPKPALPDPEKFGGISQKFDTWLPSIKAKLRVDHAAIGDPIAQFYYVYLNLESHVQAMVLPQLAQAEESERWDYNTILQQLARVFDNPNKVREAEDRLLQLRQGTDSIPVFIAKFERVLYEARGQDWPDINKISIFRNGLSPPLRSRLHQQLSLPSTYTDFVRIVQQLATRSGISLIPPSHSYGHTHDPIEIGAFGEGCRINAFGTTCQTSDSVPSRTGSPRRSRSRSRRRRRSPSPPIAPSKPRSSSLRARSISPTLRGQYRLQGRCVRCGDYEHWVQDCPQLPHRPPSPPRKRQTARRTNGVRDPDFSDSD